MVVVVVVTLVIIVIVTTITNILLSCYIMLHVANIVNKPMFDDVSNPLVIIGTYITKSFNFHL